MSNNDEGDDLNWIMSWYESHCDGDWEHQYGVEIETIDNPGWIIKIDLSGTKLEGRSLARVPANLNEKSNWIDFRVEEGRFLGACGPMGLRRLIQEFRKFSSE